MRHHVFDDRNREHGSLLQKTVPLLQERPPVAIRASIMRHHVFADRNREHGSLLQENRASVVGETRSRSAC